MNILILDNYDSFTYNLVHLVKSFDGCTRVDVFKNDAITLNQVLFYDKIILSPGPGLPQQANQMISIIETYAKTKSILGVCLGHQAIGVVFGGSLINTKKVYHGVASEIEVIEPKDVIFNSIPIKIKVGRYHSWVLSSSKIPKELIVTALGPKGEVMAIRHREHSLYGVQFHPESVLTPYGSLLIRNWLFANI